MNLAHICDDHPADQVALISRSHATTYGELRDQAAALRGGLVASGVETGDRVAIIAANNWYFVISYLAILGVGAVAVPLNPSSPGPELAREIDAVGARAIVLGPTGQREYAGVDPADIPTVETVIVAGSNSTAAGTVLIDDLLTHEPAPIVERDVDDLAVLMFTSGTAGFPKAAMLTHGNLLANLDQIDRIPNELRGPGDVSLGVLPFVHIFGLNVILGQALRTGSTVLAIERFDPESCLEAMEKHGVTTIAGAPTMWAAWSHLPGARAEAFAAVHTATSGAAPLDPAVRASVEERFGVVIDEGYGLTEASPVVTSASGLPAPAGSIGAPVPGVRVRLIDSDGADVLVGDAGEIQVKGPNVFAGYWDDADATSAALDDGWLRTGDLAVVDDNGFLFLVDRMKDLIIVSGFNVYPGEVESVIGAHPAVATAAVVGVSHPHSGEAVKAYVVVEDGAAVEEDDIIAHCERQLARYKCPQKVVFVDEVPTGLGGKVLRRSLR